MEKVTILCGMENRQKAEKFMMDVVAEIQNRGFSVEDVNDKWLVVNTPYTQVAFVYDELEQPLCRVKADAIFGFEPYKQKLAVYLKVHHPYNVGKGLVDYICEAEKNGPEDEAKAKFKDACKKYDSQLNRIRQDIWKRFDYSSLYPKQIDTVSYNKADCDITYDLYKKCLGVESSLPEIKDVVFNNPATIVFWADGTKTVVQIQENDIYDPEKGLAMAICKKIMGNKREYYHTFLHWLKKV